VEPTDVRSLHVRAPRGLVGLLAAPAAVVLLATPAAVAVLALTPGRAAAAPVCSPSDARLDEVSGLAALPGGGFVAMNDGKPGTSVLRLYVLDARCAVTRVITDRSYDPFDPEDLARTPDGTLWVADIGDNDRTRKAPAVLRLPSGSNKGTKYQLTYPSGAHDAEALLVTADRRVVVVTKNVSGVASVLVSASPLTGPAATIPMTDAGTVTIAPTTTPGGPLSGGISTVLITGAATSPDGRRVALRTYTDIYDWDVPDGDVAAALTHGEARRTPVPGEKQGESLSYTPDGSAFLTTSEGVGSPVQRWAPAARATATPSPSSASPEQAAADGDDPSGVSWQGAAFGAISACVLGLGCVAALIAVRRGWRRMRRHTR
jgi:hypothetical protein